MIRLQDLRVGLQVVHNCEPVELLYFERRNTAGELWRVRPLFTSLPDHPEVFRATDSLSYLHTSYKAAPGRESHGNSSCSNALVRSSAKRKRTSRFMPASAPMVSAPAAMGLGLSM